MITVIVPIYNTEKYLKRCIDSILEQTYKEIELILVNDGSTDKSEDICKEYLKNDNRIIYYKIENGGQGRARNYALDRCNGEWISFIDSDDWIENDMFEKMINMAETNECDIAICGWYRNHGFKQIEQPTIKDVKYYNNLELMKEYLSSNIITSSMCNKIYKKKLWEDTRFPELRAREDAAVLYKILSKSKKAVYIGESKYIQYVRPGSTERQGFSINKMNIINESRNMKTFINEKYPELSDIVAVRPAKYCANLMAEIVEKFSFKRNRKIYDELYNQLSQELSKDYSENVKKSQEYIYLQSVLAHQRLFKFKAYKSGIKIIIVDMVKKIIK